MKILHCSDTHLGKRPFGTEKFSQKRYEDYFKVFDELVEKAIEEKVEVFMVAGDLFDKRELTPDILGRSEEIFRKLSEKGIKLLITEGNHDNSNRYDGIDSWLHYLEERKLARRISYYKEKDNTYHFDVEKIGDINFYGLGFPGFNVDNVVTALSDKLDSSEKNVVMIHTAIGGGDASVLPGLVKTESLKLLKDKAIYVAGGHYHSKAVYPGEKSGERPFFFIPGSTEYWNVLNERDSVKGAYIFDTETLEYSFVSLHPRKRIKEQFVIDKNENVYEDFENWVQELNLTGEELVVVEAKILDNSYINSREMEQILERNGALKGYIVPVFIIKGAAEGEYTGEGHSSTEEIEKAIINQWNGFSGSSLPESFKELKEIQRESLDSKLFLDLFDKILEEVIGDEDK